MAHRFPALIAAPAPARGRLWLTGARLFDGTGAPLRENTAVLVEDGVIRRVADDREACPDGARPVDLEGRTLMPGRLRQQALRPDDPDGGHAKPQVVAEFGLQEVRCDIGQRRLGTRGGVRDAT